VFYFVNSFLFNLQLPIFGSYPSFIILIYLVSTTLATHELIKSGYSVIKALEDGSRIEEARKRLSLIVGRDTHTLNKKEILKATVETLAENASDGIVAPLFYFVIGGLPMAMAYKAINTLDSMVGYKNERYKDIGWAAARLDDIANFIPARITGILIVISTIIIDGLNRLSHSIRLNSLDGLNSLKIMFTDGRNHLSPNSGIPEAAMAGALRIRLGGPSTYGGILVRKPYIGREDPSSDDVYLKASKKAITITMVTSLLGFIGAVGFLYLKVGI
jgi:adenosylcobinamide-phosphate synthase